MAVMTLMEYMQECGAYAFKIIQLDKNAPSVSDINKIVSIMYIETTLDRLDFIKAIISYMEDNNMSFENALKIVRSEYKKSRLS